MGKSGCVLECRGCSHRDRTQEESEKQKEQWVRSQLSVYTENVEAIRGALPENRWAYRSKTCLHAEWDQTRWKFGLLIPKNLGWPREYEVLDIQTCPVHSEFIQGLLPRLAEILPDSGRLPLVYLGIAGKLLTLVLKSREMPDLPSIDWSALGLEGVFVNLNPSAGKRVFSSRNWHLIAGDRWGMDRGLRFGPDSFQQLISVLHQSAIQEAESFLDPGTGDGVLDLYSGIGRTFSNWKNRNVPFIGVELGGESVECAKVNFGEASCLRGRVSDRIPQLDQWVKEKEIQSLVAFVNPPRLGLETQVVEWLAKKRKPKKIAYLSCSMGTLVRDLSGFVQEGYAIQKVIPYDFFPQTHHVEALACLVANQ